MPIPTYPPAAELMIKDEKSKAWYTIPEVAKMGLVFGMKESKIRDLVRSGDLTAYRPNPNGHYRISAQAIRSYISQKKQ